MLQLSKLSKSANLVRLFCQPNDNQKLSNASVEYTVLHAIVHAGLARSKALGFDREFARSDRWRSFFDVWMDEWMIHQKVSTNPLLPNFALCDRNRNLLLVGLKQREDCDSKSRRKSTWQSSHRACSFRFCWTGLAAVIVVALRVEECSKKKITQQ